MKILLLLLLGGIILCGKTNEPLTGVRVSSKDTVVYTNFEGKFDIDADSITINYISYTPITVKNDSIITIKSIVK